jgi:hypothetical protein
LLLGLTYNPFVGLLRRYWRGLGRWLRLSQPGRTLFTVAILLGLAEIVFVRAQGDREGGAPVVVLTLVLAGVVALDAVSRGVIGVARRLIAGDGPRRHS